ncbi:MULTISPECIES: hypothetical protein [Nostocales]|jgi:hypothetical protein|uniref:Uncharacterized protein n=1 Tax=Dolichospermum flos-aquae UHCC 0037 TaxID=2590026 RepID=A0ACC7S463_DOLFA|nr:MULTISPECIES: hypothetical protein [Nostocales]MBO1052278.1 hypothetical protein [Dolichospermum sp. DET73]MBO1055243.1 hypothetical protein [Dolichospermum sp. JUN01]MBS9393433.1 hypothetical protein [Dolichospermum sp. OL01]MCO5797068.1 hypothetical protein [Dolichospermum sp. OL03]MCS6280931.1 hypothetical protein [Dolichospermum sp.]QSV58623.1 MAG: hypothetical protein HEQ29_09880 [Dolichospermum sp. LBC05a]
MNYIQQEKLDLESLKKLIRGEILAIWVPNYFPINKAKNCADTILRDEYEFYAYAPGEVGRYGLSFSETQSSEKIASQYFTSAKPSIDRIRQYFTPSLSPIDILRLELDEIWPSGANIERYNQQLMFVGLCRVIEPETYVLPHQDMVTWNVSNESSLKSIKTQLAANIYLQVPENGGDLELWSFGLDHGSYQNKSDGLYGINHCHLPEPSTSLKAFTGDLILFNAQNLHSIRPGNTHRLTASCFIGYRNDNLPLTYWS